MIDWQKIAEIALTCIASVGGVGAIIVGVVKFGGEKIAERLSKKYQLQLDKEKERYKTELSKKTYISKTRFDAEFRMYQELSEKTISMVYCAGDALKITYGEVDIDQLIQDYCVKLNDAQITNRRYAPFIAEEMYRKFYSLERNSTEVFYLVKAVRDYRNADFEYHYTLAGHTYENVDEVEKAIVVKQKAISDELNDVLKELREYLDTLDVVTLN